MQLRTQARPHPHPGREDPRRSLSSDYFLVSVNAIVLYELYTIETMLRPRTGALRTESLQLIADEPRMRTDSEPEGITIKIKMRTTVSARSGAFG